MKPTVYCISGLGADKRIFDGLELNRAPVKHIEKVAPRKSESLSQYADRLSRQIDFKIPPVIIGVSYGGMIATEIAKQHPVKSVILISSVKSRSEFPRWRKGAYTLRLWYFAPSFFIKSIGSLPLRLLRPVSKSEKELILDMLRKTPAKHLKRLMIQILCWKNYVTPENLIHIHGTKDKVMPVKKITADIQIYGGDHFMILTLKDEINNHLNRVLFL